MYMCVCADALALTLVGHEITNKSRVRYYYAPQAYKAICVLVCIVIRISPQN